MADVTITVVARSRLDSMAHALDDAMDKVAHDTADFARDAARASMVASGGGRVYGGHVASAPGRPPAIWTGQLFASVHTEHLGPYNYAADASAPYSGYLEYGTRHMAPRPFMRPAARKAAAFARVKGRVTVSVAMASAPW